MKNLILILVIFLAACTSSSRVNRSGKYIINRASSPVDGSQIVSLKGKAGEFKFISDTLKAGDTIILNVFRIK